MALSAIRMRRRDLLPNGDLAVAVSSPGRHLLARQEDDDVVEVSGRSFRERESDPTVMAEVDATPTTDRNVERDGAFAGLLRSRLMSLAGELDERSDVSAVAEARERIERVLAEVDEHLGRTGMRVAAEPSLRSAETGDVSVLAAMIAEQLQSSGAFVAARRGSRRNRGGGARRGRRSLWSSLLHTDVILSMIALAVAIIVLLAWMG
jgi:hypothetical protein